jgi:hypothetical protein
MRFEFADRIEDVWTFAIPRLAERLATPVAAQS